MRTTLATLVLSAVGLFALGMVARPLVTWKRGLIAAMGVGLLLLFATSASRAFFELAMPRPVVLMAGVGVVAIAGTVMIGGLRALGWIRTVPQALLDNPVIAASTWRAFRERLRIGERIGMLLEPARGTGTVSPPEEETTPEPQRPAEEPEVDALLDIQWFDPDEEYGPDRG